MSSVVDPATVVGAPEADGEEASLAATLELARPSARRLVWASLLGAGAVGAGIGLIATSAWLISRASQRPPESALALAIVGVQFFGLSRGLFRYAQRLVAHDVAFRSLADLRVRCYERLEALAPAGVPVFARGDLLARVVHDIDSLQDLMLRVLPGFATALLVGSATVLLMWLILPAAGLVMLAALLLAAFALTWVTARLAQRVESRQAAVRGELTDAVVDLLQGAPELTAFGALERQLDRAVGARRAARDDRRGVGTHGRRRPGVGDAVVGAGDVGRARRRRRRRARRHA